MEPRTTPIRVWRATKGARVITCEVVVWPHGIDLRTFVNGELHRSELCRTTEEWVRLQDDWREKLEAEGYVSDRELRETEGSGRAHQGRE